MNDGSAQPDDVTWDERHLRIATDIAGVGLWSWHAVIDRITMDQRAFNLWGLTPRAAVTIDDLSTSIHPDDQDKVHAALDAVRYAGVDHHFDFRIWRGDEIRWISTRCRCDGDDRKVYGVFVDVTARMQAEEQRELIACEMRHRVKNLFSVTTAVASFAAKSTDTKQEMLKDLTLRLQSLAGAYNLVHPRGTAQDNNIRLDHLLAALVKPYSAVSLENSPETPPHVIVGERCITSMAMIIHDLATNSAKFGALSSDVGKVGISCHARAEDIRIIWSECHSAELNDEFDSEMTDRIVKQLNGSLSRDWTDAGLNVTLRFDKATLQGCAG
ncbi:sensor histidine kinase [Yoonia sp.]|uniref:sensor histidine kinase n=1 Tax=Yoonia sp. TaxID=2212373 RepID=UPI003A4E0475